MQWKTGLKTQRSRKRNLKNLRRIYLQINWQLEVVIYFSFNYEIICDSEKSPEATSKLLDLHPELREFYRILNFIFKIRIEFLKKKKKLRMSWEFFGLYLSGEDRDFMKVT